VVHIVTTSSILNNVVHIVTTSVIFINKVGSGAHRDPKFGRRGGGVSYIDARIKGSGTPFRPASF
jgi:hypothetical protein